MFFYMKLLFFFPPFGRVKRSKCFLVKGCQKRVMKMLEFVPGKIINKGPGPLFVCLTVCGFPLSGMGTFRMYVAFWIAVIIQAHIVCPNH